MIITDKAQIKVAELKESNNLRLSESDELECYELIESDLKLPADATFTRNSVAYLTDGTRVPANTPRFEQGRFGKAIMVEEGTTNLLQNPSFETGNLSNWSTGFGSGITGNANIVTNPTWHGNYAVKITITDSTSTSDASVKQNINVASGVTVTLSAYLLELQGNVNAELGFRCNNGSGGYQFLRKVFTTPGYCVYTATIPDGYIADQVWLTIRPRSVGGIGYGIFDAIQLEQKPYATSFIDGTRSRETLTIPTAGVLNPQEGTIEFWWNPLAKTPQTYPSLIATGRWTNPITQDWLAIHWGSGWSNANTVAFAMYNKNGTSNFNMSVTLNPQPYIWYYVAAKWSFVTRIAKLIIYRPDGTYVSTQATINGEPPTFEGWDKFYILQTWDNGASRANSLIDDLRISSIARSDEEILAAYQSGQPLPVDEWTTYKLDFDDKVRITTQGQIICNELIEI